MTTLRESPSEMVCFGGTAWDAGPISVAEVAAFEKDYAAVMGADDPEGELKQLMFNLMRVVLRKGGGGFEGMFSLGWGHMLAPLYIFTDEVHDAVDEDVWYNHRMARQCGAVIYGEYLPSIDLRPGDSGPHSFVAVNSAGKMYPPFAVNRAKAESIIRYPVPIAHIGDMPLVIQHFYPEFDDPRKDYYRPLGVACVPSDFVRGRKSIFEDRIERVRRTVGTSLETILAYHTCSYCASRFDTRKHEKCPYCGAPM